MSQLKVYKASAGSGKTFRLAVEYMKLALTDETNYRHILAVTFTNKATAEMKSRIIGELYHLAKGEKSVYLDVLMKELGWPAMQVERQAQLVLKRILHDYSRFSISTIDSFFQRVIKAFNRELGINAAYNVELDEQSILEEAADRLIQSIDENPNLLEWLEAFASDKMREGKGWNLKKDILRLGSEIYNETFKSLNEGLYEKLNNRGFLREYHGKLSKIIVLYENKLKSLGQEGLNILAMEGLSADDFKSKASGPAGGFQKMKDLKFELNITTMRSVGDPSAWVTTSVKEPLKSRLTAVAEQKLMPKMQEAVRLVETEKRKYTSAKLIISQLYTLGILVDLRKAVKELCREKGIVLISDSGNLLKNVIADSEAPFVYEKTGSVYSHFMIDEFQDTSGLQWSNFRPLIGNSLAEDNLSMVVGDVKQAIYRWRSGDWRLLAGKLGESFPTFGLRDEVMKSNWRSFGKVIRFNNTIFKLMPKLLQQNFEAELETAGIAENPVAVGVTDVYADSVQEISNTAMAELGYVRARFLEAKTEQKEANEKCTLEELVATVKNLQDKGAKAHEIAILVRRKDEASQVADLFLAQKGLPENKGYNFDILSGESLFIANSEVIAFIVSLLRAFINPTDQVVKAEANYLYYTKIYPEVKKVRSSEFEVRSEEKVQDLFSLLFPEKTDGQIYAPELQEQFEEINNPENELIQFISGKAFQEMVSGKPILEIIYSICERFQLFSLADDLAYLQAFVDQISVFERNNASEITSFLDWWDENGERFTIPVSESIDAIHVLTIHKSKGLEFPHVLVPFFNWSITPKTFQDQAPLLWCQPTESPFNEMELVPVRYKTDVRDSIFYREYFAENFNTYIDNLNLSYVAFTRAKASLFIWASFSGKLNSVGDLLKMAVEKQAETGSLGLSEKESVQFSECYNPEKLIVEYGDLTIGEARKNKEQTVRDVRLSSFGFADFRRFLQIRKRGEDFFTSHDQVHNRINRGKIIHEILSLVTTTADLSKAIKRVELDGKIDSKDAETLREEITELLSHSEIRNWFDGTFRVVNERNILTGTHGLKRPDRIMIGKNEVIVVDYKSGETELEKYGYQLKSYIRELRNCGFTNVSGYIWYTRSNKRVKV